MLYADPLHSAFGWAGSCEVSKAKATEVPGSSMWTQRVGQYGRGVTPAQALRGEVETGQDGGGRLRPGGSRR
ncbi:hypothetical protein GCM10017778_69160 [Streptomyces vinaceus]|nr:hypothetical protein GCM10017778_69160 [Streptomyces vinaceus]